MTREQFEERRRFDVDFSDQYDDYAHFCRVNASLGNLTYDKARRTIAVKDDITDPTERYRIALLNIMAEVDALMGCNGYREALAYGDGGTQLAKQLPDGSEYADRDPSVWVGPRAHAIRLIAESALSR